jgi:serine/threonine-protein kinase
MDTDRNLLFAVLALQAGLLDRDRFVQGCALWAARKDIPLADLLVQQGWLAAEDRADLDRLLDRQLHKHNGDAQASLAEAAGPEARGALASVHDADVDRSLARLSGAEVSDRTAPHEPDGAAERAPAVPAAGRNVLLGEIGRGGMGAVFRGRDSELGRELAVKVLLEEHRGRPELVRRFQEEAQIAGQLQHPGVPPVYELGHSADGQPFFTMKLVKGHTLAALLKQRADAGAELGRFVGIFEAVCQTVAYAHAHGVIHRDLKPSNVMVGAFGEVQVMDWGLAKVLERPERQPTEQEPATRIQTLRSGSTADGSQTGMVGTPGYVAPEQARGEPADERADVFSLGAILCELLTGRPPYAGAAREDHWGMAQRAELGEALARLGGCGAGAELIDLARRCLAAQRDDRPRHAGEVAQEVAAHLASVQERARRAEQERAAAEARAQEARATAQAEKRAAQAERRRRRLTVALAAAALLLVLVGGTGAWQVRQQRADAQARQRQIDRDAQARQRKINEKALLALERGRALLEEGWQKQGGSKLKEAEAEAKRAVDVASGGAAQEVRRAADDFQQEVADRKAREKKNRALRDALLDVSAPRCSTTRLAGSSCTLQDALLHASAPRELRSYQRQDTGEMVLAEPSVDEQYDAAFQRWGLDVNRLEEAKIVARVRDEPVPVREEVVAALAAWALERRKGERPERAGRLVSIADRIDPRPERRLLRALLVGEVPPHPLTVAGVVALRGSPWPWGALTQQKLDQLPWLAELRRELSLAQESAATVLLLVQASREAGDQAGAEKVLRQALAGRPDQVVLWSALGLLLAEQGDSRLPEAIGCYQAARSVRPGLGVALALALLVTGKKEEGEAVLADLVCRRPDHPELRFYHGVALSIREKPAEAEKAFRKAADLRPDYVLAHNNLGLALLDLKRPAEAETAYRKAIALQANLASAHSNLGAACTTRRGWTRPSMPFARPLTSNPTSPRPTTTWGSPCATRRSWTRRSRPSARSLTSSPTTPRPTTTWATPCSTRTSRLRRRRPFARPSPSSRRTAWPTTAWASPSRT